MKNYPVPAGTGRYSEDIKNHCPNYRLAAYGTSGVSGAPFWNDVLKGANSFNNAVNSSAKKIS